MLLCNIERKQTYYLQRIIYMYLLTFVMFPKAFLFGLGEIIADGLGWHLTPLLSDITFSVIATTLFYIWNNINISRMDKLISIHTVFSEWKRDRRHHYNLWWNAYWMKGGTEREIEREGKTQTETNLRFAALLAQAVLFNALQGFDAWCSLRLSLHFPTQ